MALLRNAPFTIPSFVLLSSANERVLKALKLYIGI
jgi:hypothetical protein